MVNCKVRQNRVSRKIARIGLCLAFIFLMGPGQTANAATDRHVVVVCIDGFAAYLLDDPKAPVPTLRKLAKEGAVAEGGEGRGRAWAGVQRPGGAGAARA